MHPALHLQLAAEVVVGHRVAREPVVAPGQHHRKVGAYPLGVDIGVQKLAAEFQAGVEPAIRAGGRLTHHHGITKELHLGRIAVAQRPVGSGHHQLALGVVGADMHLVDLQGVGVREVAAFDAAHLALQASFFVEGLHRELAHEVVGVMPHRPLGFGRRRLGGITHQPVGAQGQQRHQHHRQVEGPTVQRVAQFDHVRLCSSNAA